MITDQPIISVRHLKKAYDDILVVHDLSFDVARGEIFGILGPNGAGKTTTIEIMETLREKTSGDVTICGYDLDKDSRRIKQTIGVQLQSSSFYLNLNLKENLELFAGLYNCSAAHADNLLELVDLSEHAHKKFKQLSGGQQQRFSLAVALIHDPEIIFLDEPTTGLDPHARRNIWDIILNLKGNGKTIVFTSHYMDEVELLCDRIAILANGKMITIDTPDNLIDQLLAKGFRSSRKVRAANLEDVFLDLTGQQFL